MENRNSILPVNWKEMTPSQKREWRLNRFVTGEGVQFVSPQAKENYRIRAQRYVDAYNIKEADRVPVNIPLGDLPYLQYGINAYTSMYEVEKAIAACNEYNRKYAEELETWASPLSLQARALDIMDYKIYAWPGHGLAREAPGYQFVEGEYMKADEYDDLLLDPSDYWLRTYLPRVFGIFDSFRLLPPLTDIIEIPSGQIQILANPRMKATLRALLDASDELERRAQILAPHMGTGPAHGFPAVVRGVYALAPFDILGDTMRGTTAIMKDMYRRPEKVLKAMDLLADLQIKSLLNSAAVENSVSIFFPLHKGADGWMSQKQFETFYFPTLKKVIDALINEGLICILFAEGGYNSRLESVNVFPKGSICWFFDQTDMFRAKKLLGDTCSIMGNVPTSLIVTGDPKDVRDYCRKLIEGVGQGGGYILSAGAIAENPKLENLQAMMEAVKEYGVYRK